MADTHIFFVADGARLELQSWLLVASLAHAHEGRHGVHLHAYASAEWMDRIGPVTKSIYRAAGVDFRPLPPAPNWAKPYPHGNKIVAATDRRGTGRGIFLDTDMVCLKPLDDLAALPDTDVAAAPEGKATWGPDDRWQRAYDHYGLPLPSERVTLLRGKRQAHLPYFNAGFVAMPETPHADGKTFGDLWLETALDFDHSCKIANKRPWLDQITLPLAMARFGYRAQVLSESYNYSLSHREDYADTPDAHILHYHRFRFLNAAPQWPGIRDRFFDLLPKSHHSRARTALRNPDLAL
ncbi:MAG: hypothetical protein RIB61_17260 [Roseicyclus sp.]